MNLTQELKEELIQEANQLIGYNAFGLNYKSDHMITDLFQQDIDGYRHVTNLQSAIEMLLFHKNYTLKYLPKHSSIQIDIVALENLLEEVPK